MTISLEAQFGYAIVDSNPSGGLVTLTSSDGKVVGRGATPYHSPRLPSGTYKVELSKDLYQNVDFNVNIPTGERVSSPKTAQLAPAIEGTEGSFLLSEYRKAMDQEVEIDFRGKRLEEAIVELSKQTGLQIRLNSSVSNLLRGTVLNFYGRTQLRAVRNHLLSGSITWIPANYAGSQLTLHLVTSDEVRSNAKSV